LIACDRIKYEKLRAYPRKLLENAAATPGRGLAAAHRAARKWGPSCCDWRRCSVRCAGQRRKPRRTERTPTTPPRSPWPMISFCSSRYAPPDLFLATNVAPTPYTPNVSRREPPTLPSPPRALYGLLCVQGYRTGAHRRLGAILAPLAARLCTILHPNFRESVKDEVRYGPGPPARATQKSQAALGKGAV
jgi:hypothetical protein